jgi:hypothetical protein
LPKKSPLGAQKGDRRGPRRFLPKIEKPSHGLPRERVPEAFFYQPLEHKSLPWGIEFERFTHHDRRGLSPFEEKLSQNLLAARLARLWRVHLGLEGKSPYDERLPKGSTPRNLPLRMGFMPDLGLPMREKAWRRFSRIRTFELAIGGPPLGFVVPR